MSEKYEINRFGIVKVAYFNMLKRYGWFNRNWLKFSEPAMARCQFGGIPFELQ